jgi:sugar transferase (PEP-CTERM system associated)
MHVHSVSLTPVGKNRFLEKALKMQMDRRQVALLRERWIGATRKARLRAQFARKIGVRKIGALVPDGAWNERRQRPEGKAPRRFPRVGENAPMVRALRQQPRRWMVFTGLVDGALLAIAVNLAMNVRYSNDAAAYAAFSQHLLERSALFAAAIVLCMFALGLYQAQAREKPLGIFLRQVLGVAAGTMLLVVLYYAIPQAYIGRGVLALAILFGLPWLVLWRALILKLMDVEMLQRRVLIFGAGRAAEFVAQRMLRRSDRQTFTVVGFVPVPGEAVKIPADQLVEIGSPIHEWAAQKHVDEIVIVPDDRRGTLPMDDLLECKQRGIEVSDLARFLERESGKVKLTVSPSWLVFSDGFNASPIRRATKRVFDVVSAAIVLAASWPLMLLTALAIRVESGPGQPILYSQERVGEHGRVFRLFKFRSMRTDAELGGVARWASKDDERVTRVGRVIRKLRLDELPQLWNVLNGTMSLIGPRPERPQFVAELSKNIPYYTLRHCVKPGLTGWAQLRYPYGSSEEDAAEKLTFDLFYVKNHNLRFDALIFLQTVEVVLFGRGAR